MSVVKPANQLSRRRLLLGVGPATAVALAGTSEANVHVNEKPSSNLRSAANFPRVSAQAAVQPSLAVIALNRMAFGPRPGDPETSVEAFNGLPGATDIDKLYQFIDRQLNPTAIDDSDYNNRVAQANFVTLDKSLTRLWSEHKESSDHQTRILPMKETERVTFLRAVYSRHQLVEVLADFWHNHFNVYGWDGTIASVFVHYDRDVIRNNMFGRFRDMLEAVAKSTAMLYYLDNYLNTRSGPNENWAREVFELHTLGAENYLGSQLSQQDVPRDGAGWPTGYVDGDVYEASRAFTGWTVANGKRGTSGDTGRFEYIEEWHDRFQKTVLGRYFPPNQTAATDGNGVLDRLAEHPGTARHVCRKLCRRLIADNPPESIVQSAADLFLAQKDASDQLKQVVRHILRSQAFRSTWGQKVKRPFEAIAATLRATNGNFSFAVSDSETNRFLGQFKAIGQPLYSWKPPDGYPDFTEAWANTTALVMRWRMMNWLVDRKIDSEIYRLDLLGQTPTTVRSPNALVDFWVDRLLNRAIDPADRQKLVDFMAQGSNANADLALTSSKAISRLQALAALLVMSPEFQWR